MVSGHAYVSFASSFSFFYPSKKISKIHVFIQIGAGGGGGLSLCTYIHKLKIVVFVQIRQF